MCRGSEHVQPQARQALAALLADLARTLADREGVDRELVRIGPVDFGQPEVSE